MKTLILLAASFFFMEAQAAVTCHYSFMQIPMSDVTLEFGSDGQPLSPATITMQGRSHQETVTPETVATGETVHVWLSKESADNSIEMVIYDQPHTEGRSKLTNHHVPYGQDMWGNCQ